ncbi:hypothetical protein JCM10213v2_005872 [Rhodosporidiobolus nylandii]
MRGDSALYDSHADRANILTALFDKIRLDQFHQLGAHFADSAIWELHPASAAEAVGAPDKGRLSAKEVVTAWQSMKESEIKESKSLEVHSTVQEGDSLAARVTSTAILKDSKPFVQELVFFITFEPHTAKIKHCVEVCDSALVVEYVKKTGFKLTV